MAKSGPGYNEAIIHLKNQQADNENTYTEIVAGVQPAPRRRKYVQKDERIQTYIDRWMSPLQHDIDHNDVVDTARLGRLRTLSGIAVV